MVVCSTIGLGDPLWGFFYFEVPDDMANEKSTAVLATELQSLSQQVAELKGLFSAFQTNFIRSDIYTVRHEEIVANVAKLQKDAASFRSDIDKAKGAITFMKVVIGLLTFIATLVGSLWWVKG
jgi:hypothetical protein